jgi:hypothetical protein
VFNRKHFYPQSYDTSRPAKLQKVDVRFVIGICLPLAQVLSIEEAAHSVAGHFVTTCERAMFRAHMPMVNDFLFNHKQQKGGAFIIFAPV